MTDEGLSGAQDANFALNELRALIAAPELGAQGGKLPPERELTQRLGITRHSLRQALEVLETEGLIWRRRGAGTFIGVPTDHGGQTARSSLALTSFDEVMEARLRIEPQLAQLAALRALPQDLKRLREFNRRCIEASDPESCELWDGAFHRQLAVAAGNRLLLSMLDLVNHVRQERGWQLARSVARDIPGALSATARFHSAILHAVAEGDAVAAGQAMRDHLLDIHQRLQHRLTDFDLGLGTLPSAEITPFPNQPQGASR